MTYGEWISKANASEDYAKGLDRKAHLFPINTDMFLEAAKYSRKSAQFQLLASQVTNDLLQKSVALSNHYSMIGNVYKSLGNYFYYSLKLSRAATYFERARIQFALSRSHVPRELDNYKSHIQDLAVQETHLEAIVADCRGGLAKSSEKWDTAITHFLVAKDKYKRLRSFGGDYVRSLNISAVLHSIEREIETCQVVISLNNLQLAEALKHAESAVTAAEESLKEYPDWIYFQKTLVSTVELKEHMKHAIGLKKVSALIRKQEARFSETVGSFITNLLSYKFEKEVEYYLRQEHQYSRTLTRYKPPYLNREIDVYASKGDRKTVITVCECKLRLNNQPISAEEVEKFAETVERIREYEHRRAQSEGKQVMIRLWLVTNTSLVEGSALEVAKRSKIKIMKANLPKGFTSNPNWRLSGLQPIHNKQ